MRSIEEIENRLEALPFGPEAKLGQPSVAYRSEEAVRNELILQFKHAVSGTQIDIGMFYFSDRKVIEALKGAIKRGAFTRILLDANCDAFGSEKNGMPNRTVAAELMELSEAYGVEIRWAATNGEQFHGKFLRIAGSQQQILFLGSANWTRRNLANLNLESNLLLSNSPEINREFDAYFDSVWNNKKGYEESLSYEAWAETGWSLRWRSWLYHFQEWSGASTF
jgi:phosphatidylserine/phosphatidylglycerophosphate/cardiolipin synthase-like enzyme